MNSRPHRGPLQKIRAQNLNFAVLLEAARETLQFAGAVDQRSRAPYSALAGNTFPIVQIEAIRRDFPARDDASNPGGAS